MTRLQTFAPLALLLCLAVTITAQAEAMPKRLLDAYGRPMPNAAERSLSQRMSDLRAEQAGMLQGRYDAAQTTDHNSRHWANADALSANAENSPEVCRRLRSRARYEFGNNSYVQGLALTIANHTVGTGPRLQMQTPDQQANQFIERVVHQWMTAIRFAPKLRVAVLSRFIDGAALGIKTYNPKVPHAVKLDFRVRDYDRLQSPDMLGATDTQVDGIKSDSYGNPIEYHLLKDHPGGDLITGANPYEYDRIPAKHVCHWYRTFRPEQDRGRPEITPALPLFAQLRRYTLAVLRSAELAAEIAGVIKTNASAVTPAEVESMDAIELEMGHLLTLPAGWDISQMKSEQPVTTYGMFKEELLVEAGRCVNAHRGIMLGDHSKYNYASGRLDKQNWHTMLDLDRQDCELFVLEPILVDVLAELALVGMLPDVPAMSAAYAPPPVPMLRAAAGYLDILGRTDVANWLKGESRTAPSLPNVVLAMRDLKAAGYDDAAAAVLQIPHCWGWDGQKHVDRAKEANGQKIELQNGTTTRRRELLAVNVDIDQADQEAAESYGVDVQTYQRRLFDLHFPPASQAPSSSEGEGREEGDTTDDEDAEQVAAAWQDADAETQEAIRELLTV